MCKAFLMQSIPVAATTNSARLTADAEEWMFISL
jgi:hypothetical protein